MKKQNLLLLAGAGAVLYFMYRKKQLNGSGVTGIDGLPKYKYTFQVVLKSSDGMEKLLEHKKFTTIASQLQTARNRAYKKYPYPYFVELYSTEKL
jgi:hypothetical protein